MSSAGPCPMPMTAREQAREPTPEPAPAAETSSEDATPVALPIKLGTKPRANKPVKKDIATKAKADDKMKKPAAAMDIATKAKAKAVAPVMLKMKKPAAAMHKPRVTHRAYAHAHVRRNRLCTHARADKRATRATCIRFGTRGSNFLGTA